MPLIFRKQPSGGRGEYELVGGTSKVVASDLAGYGFVWQTPFGQKETEVALSGQGGKRRLRITKSGVPHVQRQAAALCMLPKSTRDEASVWRGQPIILQNAYVLDVQLDLLAMNSGMAVVRPSLLIARSGNIADVDHIDEIGVADRWYRMQEVWKKMDVLPPIVRSAVIEHRDSLIQESVVGVRSEEAVRKILGELEAISVTGYVPGTDPLPALEFLTGLAQEPQLPLPTEAPTEFPEIRIRLESQYRLARMRGSSHQIFKRKLQRAYNFRCAFCGMKALNVPGLARSGVDAAHILPWGKFDLDVVQNGLILCKRDHWAFDSHVLILSHWGGEFSVNINQRYADAITDADTLTVLSQATGKIPEERLPHKKKEWPNPAFLHLLYSDIE